MASVFHVPVQSYCEWGALRALPELAVGRVFVVSAPSSLMRGTAEIQKMLAKRFAGIYSQITPNPYLHEAAAAADEILASGAETVVAIGGGSALDLAKYAVLLAESGRPNEYVLAPARKKFRLIAVPTTAGTGSEVTSVAVLTDKETGIKAPYFHEGFFPDIALADASLTRSVPPKVTAESGLDALAHALEGAWSVHHNQTSDVYAAEAVRLVFAHLLDAYQDGQNMQARDGMMRASHYAGLAFANPKTAASHACSYPLTYRYGIPHGAACALTLDAVLLKNAEVDDRLAALAQATGFRDVPALAAAILDLKKQLNLPCTLREAGVPLAEVPLLAAESLKQGAIKNNPFVFEHESLEALFLSLSKE